MAKAIKSRHGHSLPVIRSLLHRASGRGGGQTPGWATVLKSLKWCFSRYHQGPQKWASPSFHVYVHLTFHNILQSFVAITPQFVIWTSVSWPEMPFFKQQLWICRAMKHHVGLGFEVVCSHCDKIWYFTEKHLNLSVRYSFKGIDIPHKWETFHALFYENNISIASFCDATQAQLLEYRLRILIISTITKEILQ